jgi:aryl-alcohol dehydrogenase-like predicted oxidoreductase|tara:strand:- start:589 stop:786 length:198 start_codon:yes stop_codon:yes gene_type:complete
MALLQDLLHDSGAVAFGSWQLGGSAGDWHTGVDDSESIAALHAFIDGGVCWTDVPVRRKVSLYVL